ncbi:MAG: PQQ-dependent sugar dehydrogenase, partial [Saprospiraceae bacterium]
MQKTTLFPAVLGLILLTWTFPVFSQNEIFQLRSLACNLSQPWEITYGPDNYLWVTEALSYQVSRIDPVTGNAHQIADLSQRKDFPNNLDPFPQGGLMGLALHPEFMTGKPFVYLAYVYHFDSCAPDKHGCYFRTRISRFTYDMTGDSLKSELVVLDSLPGSTDHNGGRLTIGPVGNKMYLFYGIGDMGAGQFANQERTHNGQNLNIYEGKILRLNLDPDSDPVAADRWIPNDNPYESEGAKSAVWTLGHRNPQGLVFGPTGILYESEHGPYSDDEINVILPQRNYGFPLVVGYADGNYNGSAVALGSTVPQIIDEQANAQALGAAYKDPIKSFFPASQSMVSTIFNNEKNSTPPFPNYYLSWPSAAPSGIEYYGSDAIPGWKNSLLVATLKLGRVF